MTNPQGAPEALAHELFAAAQLAPGEGISDAVARIAALVDAQQPAAHVQNPAGIEHVAGDVSKTGAESNMAQQPAPSAAAATEVENLRKALQFYADKDHFNIADDGAWDTVSGEPQNYWCDEEGTATVEDGTIARLALAGHQIKFDADEAPQPSPTPQADSQPAPVRDYPPLPDLISSVWPFIHTNAAADSAAMVAKTSDQVDAAIHDLLRAYVDADRAARATADSVTAPAATPAAASIAWNALRDATDPLGETGTRIMGLVRVFAQRQYEAGLAEGRATQPAKAADSVLEDAARYRWLADMNDWYAEPRLDEADGTKWQLTFYSPQRIEDAMDDDSLDTAVDAARKQGGEA